MLLRQTNFRLAKAKIKRNVWLYAGKIIIKTRHCKMNKKNCKILLFCPDFRNCFKQGLIIFYDRIIQPTLNFVTQKKITK